MTDSIPAPTFASESHPEPDPRRTPAAVISAVAAIGFVVVRLIVELDHDKALPIDHWWHSVMLSTLTPGGVIAAEIPSFIGGTIGMFVIGIPLVLIFLWKKRRWDAATIAIAVALVVAIGAPMSWLIGRVRPSDSLAEAYPASFPSGHTAVATTFVIILGLLLRRWYVWAAGAVWVVYMMWARTYLHAHWLSDVVAGLLEGIAVALFVWCVIQAYHDRRARKALAAGAHADAEAEAGAQA
jgi:undecaprenyl-diphosphatase